MRVLWARSGWSAVPGVALAQYVATSFSAIMAAPVGTTAEHHEVDEPSSARKVLSMANKIDRPDFDQLYRDERSVDGLPALTTVGHWRTPAGGGAGQHVTGLTVNFIFEEKR